MSKRIAADIALQALEVRLRVSIAGVRPRELDEFLASWDRCGAGLIATRPWNDTGGYAATVCELDGVSDEAVDFRTESYPELLELLSGVITRHAIHHRRHELLLLHAAGVADPITGSTVVLIGPSGRGKTTSARTLATRFAYVSDETIGITDELSIVAYPKPLSVLHSDRDWKVQTSPSALGLRPLPDIALYPSALVLLEREERAEEPELTPVTIYEVAEDLFPQISYLSERDQPLRRLEAIVSRVGLYRLRYTDAVQLEAVIGPLFDATSPVPLPQLDHAPKSPAPARPLTRGQIVRRPATDNVGDDAATLVLIDQRLIVLKGIGPAIWHTTEQAQTVVSLTKAIVHQLGDPADGDPGDLVREAVASLETEGLLTHG